VHTIYVFCVSKAAVEINIGIDMDGSGADRMIELLEMKVKSDEDKAYDV
jgi:hypothetical protein